MSEYTRTFAGLLSKMWDQNPNTRPPAQQAILTLCNLTDKPDTSGGSAPLPGGEFQFNLCLLPCILDTNSREMRHCCEKLWHVQSTRHVLKIAAAIFLCI